MQTIKKFWNFITNKLNGNPSVIDGVYLERRKYFKSLEIEK